MQNLRELYRPNKLNLLFVGESPPIGETFFYAGNSSLFTYTRQAFSEALNHQWDNAGNFLNYFQSKGCYLEDLCLNPINNLRGAARRAQHTLGIVPLADRLSQWENKPHTVIIVGRSIEEPARASLSHINWHEIPTYALPFAGNGHQNTYVNNLKEILETALIEGWIELPNS